jgi:hypothetical protein
MDVQSHLDAFPYTIPFDLHAIPSDVSLSLRKFTWLSKWLSQDWGLAPPFPSRGNIPEDGYMMLVIKRLVAHTLPLPPPHHCKVHWFHTTGWLVRCPSVQASGDGIDLRWRTLPQPHAMHTLVISWNSSDDVFILVAPWGIIPLS